MKKKYTVSYEVDSFTELPEWLREYAIDAALEYLLDNIKFKFGFDLDDLGEIEAYFQEDIGTNKAYETLGYISFLSEAEHYQKNTKMHGSELKDLAHEKIGAMLLLKMYIDEVISIYKSIFNGIESEDGKI